MPSERFYRLTEEKKKCIMLAARKEFARVSFEKASINKIIQDANISRGSFYTYFEDKSDVVKCILEEHKQVMTDACVDFLKEHEGDLFYLFDTLFDRMIERFQDAKEDRDMISNILEYHKNRDKIPPFESEGGYGMLKALYPHVNQTMWKTKSIEATGLVASMSGMVLLDSFIRYHHNPENVESIQMMYHKKISILQYGTLDK